MTTYFIRRFLLAFPTFIGITLIAFTIIQFVPGGPLEQEIIALKMGMSQMGEAGAGSSSDVAAGGSSIPAEALEEMKAYYGYDKPVILNFRIWNPQKHVDRYMEALTHEQVIAERTATLAALLERVRDGEDTTPVRAQISLLREEIKGLRDQVDRMRSNVIACAEIAVPALLEVALDGTTRYTEDQREKAIDLLVKRLNLPVWTSQDLGTKLAQVEQWAAANEAKGTPVYAKVWKTFSYGRYGAWLVRIFQLDLGKSHRYSRPVWEVMKTKFPVSIYFGAIGLILVYSVCIPLGVWKAVKHGSTFDTASSVIVFIGYSIPGWALGAVLLVLLGGGSFWDVFPLGGFRSEDWEFMNWWDKIWDQVHHTILPIIAWEIASFARMTILMKNSLMENLSSDYVRTAFAKGLSERRVVFLHALRNSLIPLATGLGHLISFIFAGSYLIEKVFNIDGFGLLGFNSLIHRDYPVVLASLVIGAVIGLMGNILSDMIYAAIDPRIRFK
ncbi:MAG: ABC transporter permease subunit [bacterium]|jgi:microcin C transport system permease protein|nr:ABC transporter permease subunit [bacterium]